MARILHVEDLPELASLLGEELTKKYEVRHAPDLKTAQTLLESEHFDLLLLDVSLPDGSALDFYETVKTGPYGNIPVIFLTGQLELTDRIRGLELGAQDYIVKPFYSREVILRIDMRLKQFTSQAPEFLCADLKFEKTRHQVYLIKNKNTASLNLTPNEYKILALLATNREQIFSRHKIVESVWGADTHISDKAVNSHISNLRKKIQDSVCKISSEDKGYFLKIS
jgi:DNA-binding response OmpR family regulator